MDITPDQLQSYLMVLRDAGVRRARLGDVEVEFTPDQSDAAEALEIAKRVEAKMDEFAHAVTTPITAVPTKARVDGYTALLGAERPKFVTKE